MASVLYIGEIFGVSSGCRLTETLTPMINKTHLTSIMGIGYKGDPHSMEMDVYPASLKDPMGFKVLDRVLMSCQADVVVIHCTARALLQYFVTQPKMAPKTVAIINQGSGLIPVDEMAALSSCGALIGASEAARDSIMESALKYSSAYPDIMDKYQQPIPYFKGMVSDELFFQPPDDDNQYHKKMLGLPTDAVVFGSVTSNTKRARLDLLLQLFKSFNQGFLILHTPFKGYFNLANLTHHYGIEDKVFYTMNNTVRPYDSDLRLLYWAMDYHLSTASSDSVTLNVLEAAACGTKQITSFIRPEKFGYELVPTLTLFEDCEHRIVSLPKEINLLDVQRDDIYVQEFSWEKASQTVLDSIQKVLND